MSEASHQSVRNREITHAGVGIDVRRRTAHDSLDDPEPRMLTDHDLLPGEIELAPSRPATHVDIAAEAQRMDGCADYALDNGDGGQVDDRDHLARDVGETEARC